MDRDSATKRLSDWDRFWSQVVESDEPSPNGTHGCWLWTGNIGAAGYGRISLSGRKQYAHRVAYRWVVGAIRRDLTIDHTCRNHRCVNPQHLEAVTRRENILRGESPSAKQARQTHCKRGHPLSGENVIRTGRRRRCRACDREWHRQRKEHHHA